MSVVGFDFGNESGIVAVARQKGIDVVLNDESKRETPAIVCFGDKQRFIGIAGAATTMMNPKNSLSQIKRLIGRLFSDPELQRDIKALPFTVIEGPDGYPLIQVRYLVEVGTFTPTQVLGTVFSDLKTIAEKNLNAAVVDCCIGIPIYFTDLQRRAVMDAATIAGLHPLRLFHETTATALAYGIYKTDLPENDQINVAFVDIGHASMQVCIAGFKKGQLEVLAHAFDQSLGGRDFDEALFQHFVGKFKEEYKIDVLQNARARLRLRAACEKLKKVLSANPEAPLNIDCLMEEKDVRGYIKRDEFEQISIPILERVKGPLEKALSEAGLTIENIHSVEVVGSGTRVPAVIRVLTEFFGKEPTRTMNASECVARGCALQCAMLSPTFKVREFQVNESFPYPIALSWKGSSPDSVNGAADHQQSTIVFPKGNPLPSIKALTFNRSETFTIDVQYADISEVKAPIKISTYMVGPFPSKKGECSKLKVKVRLNIHGIVFIDSATLLEEEEVEVPVVREYAKEVTKMDTDDAPAGTDQTDVNMQDAKGTTEASGVEPALMETNVKVQNTLGWLSNARSVLNTCEWSSDRISKILLIKKFVQYFWLPGYENSVASLVLKAIAKLTQGDCGVFDHFMKCDGIIIVRRMIATAATSVEENNEDAPFMSSLEALLTVMISHNSQQPCMCKVECKCAFFIKVLTIPFVWRYFPGLIYVFVSDTLWIKYFLKFEWDSQLAYDDNELCDSSSCGKPLHACLLDNLLEIIMISLPCSFDMALDFTDLLSILLEKSMDVSKDFVLDLLNDDIRTIIMDEELSKEISRKLNSSLFCTLATALCVAPEGEQEDKLQAALVSLLYFLYHSFHTFIGNDCGKKIFSELLGSTNIMESLLKFLNVAGIKDSPKCLVIFSMLYKHMLLELDDVELYQMKHMITFLKEALWKLLWVIPARASYPVTVSDMEDADPKIYDQNVSNSSEVSIKESSYLEDFYLEESDSEDSDPKVGDDLDVSDPKILLHLAMAKHRACIRVSELLRELVYYNYLRCYTSPIDFYAQIEDDEKALFVSKVRPKDQRVRRVLLLAPFLVPFEIRLKIFSGKLAAKRQPYPDVSFGIHRHHLLKDAFDLFQFKLPTRRFLWHKVSIVFLDINEKNEGGVDTGGLFNEFMDMTATTAFSVKHGLFRENKRGLLYPYHEESKRVSSDTDKKRKSVTLDNEEVHEELRMGSAQQRMKEAPTSNWFSFLGTVLGKALFDEIPVNIQFAPSFLRRLISQRRTWYTKDLLGCCDPEIYENLNKMKKFSDDEFSEMELDFTLDEDENTVKLTMDGKPMVSEDGTPMLVTTNNVRDYISAVVSHYLDKEVRAEDQTRYFLSSFHKVIPKDWISIFDERELQLLISGLPNLDVEYLRKNCIYRGGYGENHQNIMDFWEVLTGFSNDAKVKFLKFVTGLPVIKYPGTNNSKAVLEIHRSYDDDDSLPTSASCSNILRLPKYSSKDVLESRLWMAIHETEGFDEGIG